MIYKVRIKELVFKLATVQADTIEEAREIALAMAVDNEADLEAAEYIDADGWEVEEVG